MALIDKLTAAERLILSGIVMVERNDDPLAVHVVAASALSLLRELIDKGGDNHAAMVLQQGLFHAAAARRAGTPVNLPTSPEIDALIDDVAAGIEKGAIKHPSDLTVTLDAKELHKLLGYITRPFNFLKHAQKDPLATLDESDVDGTGAIMHAVTAYTMLCPAEPLPEQVGAFLRAHGII